MENQHMNALPILQKYFRSTREHDLISEKLIHRHFQKYKDFILWKYNFHLRDTEGQQAN
ncbi:hypothetical protein [Nitrospira defluvii]|uniref:Transposase n=1 Tax=Nitrospira defluvii TaxID=330214 RepID=A0ABM8R9X1_9BACT|nr:hypothetical protein [Nitrospira defluvii]CAE6740699.1 hypothetical protein NSPZN2_130076 [Nitrospira defluvii]